MTAADALRAFAADLETLRRKAGAPTLMRLVELTASHLRPLARSTISDKLNAKSLPDWAFVEAFVAACAEHAASIGMPLAPALTDLGEWDAAYLRMLRDFDDVGADARLAATAGVELARRTHETTTAGTVPRQLPPPLPHFVGRTRELVALARAYGDGHRVIVIDGTAGIGKTALALHWAHEIAGDFPDGQLFVDLCARRATPTADALCVLLEAFDPGARPIPVTYDGRVAHCRSLLAGRRILLVLDDAADSDQARSLLPGTPGCLVLVTSRNRLSGLVTAEGAHPVTVGLLSGAESRELLARRIGAGRVSAEPAAAADLVELSARLPLALSVVAARAAGHPGSRLADLAAEVRGARWPLDAFAAPGSDLRAALAASHSRLSPPAATVFRLLGRGPVRSMSTADAAATAGISREQALVTMSELARAHFVEEEAPGRFSQHHLLHAYAAELAAAAGIRRMPAPRRSPRPVWYAVMTAALAMLLAMIGLSGSSASANVTGGYLIRGVNRSDPHITLCSDSATNFSGYCMYTSSDLGSGGRPGNPYPMNQTFLHTLSWGLDPSRPANWVDRGAVFEESRMTTDVRGGFVPPGADRLGAPATALGPDFTTYLYVPDASASGMRIGVARSPSPFGPFTYLRQIDIPGYASDPEVFPTSRTDGPHYLLWTDGDAAHCGALEMAQLHSGTMADLASPPQTIQIDGAGVLGDCGGTGHPYMQGPSLYDFSRTTSRTGLPGKYTLVFTARPEHVPVECMIDKGQSGTANEVIAYATADAVTGPYAYRGLLMCGSWNQWSNQATLTTMYTNHGQERMVIVYHDGQKGTHNRRLDAECLWSGDGTFATVYPSAGGFQDCMAGADSSAVLLRASSNGMIVSATYFGTSSLRASRAASGPWERFDLIGQPDGTAALRARVSGRYAQAAGSTRYPLIANGATVSFLERFDRIPGASGGIALSSRATGMRVRVAPDGLLTADGSARSTPELFGILRL